MFLAPTYLARLVLVHTLQLQVASYAPQILIAHPLAAPKHLVSQVLAIISRCRTAKPARQIRSARLEHAQMRHAYQTNASILQCLAVQLAHKTQIVQKFLAGKRPAPRGHATMR